MATTSGKLQQFLLELGKGFLFETRQKRFKLTKKNYNNTATPKSGCYTLGLETDEVAEANAKVIDFVA